MNKTTLRIWVLAVMVLTALTSQAQKIQTVDTEGNPVSYASVANADNGKIIGATDLHGILSDVGGARSISITHVAFSPQVVNMSSLPKDGRIILQDGKFDLPEVVVSKKELIYVQTYYRVIYMHDDTLVYFRAGVTDNVYDIKKKSVSSSHEHFSKAVYGILKFTLDKIAGGYMDKNSDLSTSNLCLSGVEKNGKLTTESETDGRKTVKYNGEIVGFMVDDTKDHQRRLSIDNNLYRQLYHADNDSEKQAKKREKREESKKNEESTRYMVYDIDDDGHCGVADFVSKQVHTDYDQFSKMYKKDIHTRLWIEVYATDRAYVTKQELKEKKSDNKIKLTYENLLDFESQHGIPPMPENSQKSLAELMKK
jgi:hypothetical protein